MRRVRLRSSRFEPGELVEYWRMRHESRSLQFGVYLYSHSADRHCVAVRAGASELMRRSLPDTLVHKLEPATEERLRQLALDDCIDAFRLIELVYQHLRHSPLAR